MLINAFPISTFCFRTLLSPGFRHFQSWHLSRLRARPTPIKHMWGNSSCSPRKKDGTATLSQSIASARALLGLLRPPSIFSTLARWCFSASSCSMLSGTVPGLPRGPLGQRRFRSLFCWLNSAIGWLESCSLAPLREIRIR